MTSADSVSRIFTLVYNTPLVSAKPPVCAHAHSLPTPALSEYFREPFLPAQLRSAPSSRYLNSGVPLPLTFPSLIQNT
jgi:hypothetical protein